MRQPDGRSAYSQSYQASHKDSNSLSHFAANMSIAVRKSSSGCCPVPKRQLVSTSVQSLHHQELQDRKYPLQQEYLLTQLSTENGLCTSADGSGSAKALHRKDALPIGKQAGNCTW